MSIKKNEQEQVKERELNTAESVYTVKELAENANRVFGTHVRSECVIAALWNVGKEFATISEAKDIVNKFMKKEVK